MKKLVILLTICLFGIVAYAAGVGPEEMNLKERWQVEKQKAVIFPHWLHQKGNSCSECHVKPGGGKPLKDANGKEFIPEGKISGMNNIAHKDFCWPCHTKKSVAVGKNCAKCHKG